MAFTYDGDPAGSDLAALRFSIGDTDSNDQQFQDAELTYLLTTYGSVEKASVEAVTRLIAKYARLVDKAVGDLKMSYSQRVKQYKTLLAERRRELLLAKGGGVVAGGLSKTRKRSVAQDTDRVEPAFERGQFDHPGVNENRSELADYD